MEENNKYVYTEQNTNETTDYEHEHEYVQNEDYTNENGEENPLDMLLQADENVETEFSLDNELEKAEQLIVEEDSLEEEQLYDNENYTEEEQLIVEEDSLEEEQLVVNDDSLEEEQLIDEDITAEFEEELDNEFEQVGEVPNQFENTQRGIEMVFDEMFTNNIPVENEDGSRSDIDYDSDFGDEEFTLVGDSDFIQIYEEDTEKTVTVTKNNLGEYIDGTGNTYTEEYVLSNTVPIVNEEVTEQNNEEELTYLDELANNTDIDEVEEEDEYNLFDTEEEFELEIYDEETEETLVITKNVLGNYVDGEGNIYTEEYIQEILREDEDNETEDTEEIDELKAIQAEYRDKIQDTISAKIDVGENDFHMKSSEGGTIPTRQNGVISVEFIPIDDIKITKRTRNEGKPSYDLQESLTRFGQLSPIHVVKYGEYYLLLNGRRRLEALKHNGKDHVVAIVDDTIAPQLVKYYEAIVNNQMVYSFDEMIQYAKYMQTTQPDIDVTVIESILGLGKGEMYKALYVDSMRDTYAEIYGQLANGKLSIDQAFKKIEKEIAKAEKEGTGDNMDELNSGAMDDQLRSVDELSQMQNEPDQQDVHNRKILDPVLRRSVESRDKGYCQCCEYGKGEPDLMGVFNVHHMIAVMYGGSDSQSNLILLCSNCHTLVHDYERGRFQPEKETYDKHIYIQKIIVLGNMLATMKKKALTTLRSKFESTARLVDANKMGLGKAIHKHNILLDGEKYFNGSPYSTFVESTKNLNLGGTISGELGELNYEDEDSEETISIDENKE